MVKRVVRLGNSQVRDQDHLTSVECKFYSCGGGDRKSRQLETAGLMTGAAAQQQRQPKLQPMEVIDVGTNHLG